MINVIATYTVRPEFAEQNKNNIQIFLKDFALLNQDVFSYSVFVKDDGVTFVHQSVYKNEEIQNEILSLPSFKEFQKQRDENAVPGSHKVEIISPLGSSGNLLNESEEPLLVSLTFEKIINAPAQRVWDALWSNETYGEWTKHFHPGSSMQSDWKIDGRTYFTDESGKNGMVSTIIRLYEPKEVVFKHVGILKDGVEDTRSDDAESFAGALESYRLTEEDGITTLIGSVETFPQYEQHMRDGFEKGFEEVKKLAEETKP